MASMQNGKMGMQYQPYANSNPIPGVTAVGPTAVQPDCQYGSQPQVIHHNVHHQQQRQLQQKPTILNHTMNGGSVMSPIQYHQPVQQQHLPPPQKTWLLVEWEMPPGEPNTYTAIDSSELVLHSTEGGVKETISTGKTIFVKRGKRVQQATVVIISEDKHFIDTEVMQLRKMAAENLQLRNQDHCNRNGMIPDVGYANKRRRLPTTPSGSDEAEPVSPEYDPLGVQSQIATANWVSKCKTERVLSPSPSVRSAHTSVVVPSKPPPMTFDQQTQTDAKFFPSQDGGQLSKILSIQETILAEQKSVRMENEYNRKIMFDIVEQLNTFSETLKNLEAKVMVDNTRFEVTEVVKHPSTVGSYVILGTGDEESRDPQIHTAPQKRTLSNESENNMHIDSLSLQDDSSMSLSQSKFSVQEETSSATSTPKNLNFSKRPSSSALSVSNVSVYSPIGNTNNSTVNDVLKDWNDDDGDDNELTPIGPNNTMVKRQILRAINWTNYKAATRKLLMTLFTREILSSHTLTGRPSPAFMGDRAKPVKDKLDQKIIADIIAIVTKTCSVSEPMVRTAITTKCADENKMSRMKSGKAASQTIMTRYIRGTAEDNQGQSQIPPESPIIHSKRIKRENKENVQ
ncbi:uncharacterized protein LOC129778678 [Toxorhynchites rutilus septentrionalis]|uniref:uncharacterized protein LOC129778678 n=1 Tax=Toxorhynchites rutilus septentrionalis TaxID=329112 RepID=UPI0024798F03|nr:uncharacterized protein LOC129778678 [Toxorhynchites rutilus septentrionalis]XP_055641717.1 uncharacterized protein LOC129778678 [Toxorhynchites rutilus septentrionalis]XP_055641718.1 uncharacterized protein LOC129778678 [Toxorhynchites rutilus septentrionalis]